MNLVSQCGGTYSYLSRSVPKTHNECNMGINQPRDKNNYVFADWTVLLA